MVLRPGGPLRDARPLLACLSLGFAVIGALVILLSVVSPAGAQATGCETSRKPEVPGAVRQDADCLPDLTTRTLGPDHTRPDDWAGLHAAETVNPAVQAPRPTTAR